MEVLSEEEVGISSLYIMSHGFRLYNSSTSTRARAFDVTDNRSHYPGATLEIIALDDTPWGNHESPVTSISDSPAVDDVASGSSGSYHTALCSNQLSDSSETFQDFKQSSAPRHPVDTSSTEEPVGSSEFTDTNPSPKRRSSTISCEPRDTDLPDLSDLETDLSCDQNIVPSLKTKDLLSKPQVTGVPPELGSLSLMDTAQSTEPQETTLTLQTPQSTVSYDPTDRLNVDLSPGQTHKPSGTGFPVKPWKADRGRMTATLADLYGRGDLSPRPKFTSGMTQIMLKRMGQTHWDSEGSRTSLPFWEATGVAEPASSFQQPGNAPETSGESPRDSSSDWRSVSIPCDSWPGRGAQGEGAGQRDGGRGSSGREQQVGLSLTARNRKATASRSLAFTAAETQPGMSAGCCSSSCLSANRQEQNRTPRPAPQNPAGTAHKVPEGVGQASSMESEVDEADSEVRWISDQAFKSLSSPPVDYLDVYNSSSRSSANASQPSTEESTTAAAWSPYAELRGSALWESEDLSRHQPPGCHDDGDCFATGDFECVDVALESTEEGQGGTGSKTVPKREIQLRRCNTEESQPDENGKMAAETAPALKYSKGIYLRQHSTPAAVQEESYKTRTEPESALVNRKQRLQKSISLDETSSKTKIASSLIKNVLSKKMQFEHKLQQLQLQEGDFSPSQSSPVSDTPKTKVNTLYLGSSLPLDRSSSPEDLPHEVEPAPPGSSVKQHESVNSKTHQKPLSKHSFNAFQSIVERPESYSGSAGTPGFRPGLSPPFGKEKTEKQGPGDPGERLANSDPGESRAGDSAKASAGGVAGGTAKAPGMQARTTNRSEECRAAPGSHKQQSVGNHFLSKPPETGTAPCVAEEEKNAAPPSPDPDTKAAETPGPASGEGAAGKDKQRGRCNRRASEKSRAIGPIHKVRDVRQLVKNTYNLSFGGSSIPAQGCAFQEKEDKPPVLPPPTRVQADGRKEQQVAARWAGERKPGNKPQLSPHVPWQAPPPRARETTSLHVSPVRCVPGGVASLVSFDKKSSSGPGCKPTEATAHSASELGVKTERVPCYRQKPAEPATSSYKKHPSGESKISACSQPRVPKVTSIHKQHDKKTPETAISSDDLRLTEATTMCGHMQKRIPTTTFSYKEQPQKPPGLAVTSTNKQQQALTATTGDPSIAWRLALPATSYGTPRDGSLSHAPDDPPILGIQEGSGPPLPSDLTPGRSDPYQLRSLDLKSPKAVGRHNGSSISPQAPPSSDHALHSPVAPPPIRPPLRRSDSLPLAYQATSFCGGNAQGPVAFQVCHQPPVQSAGPAPPLQPRPKDTRQHTPDQPGDRPEKQHPSPQRPHQPAGGELQGAQGHSPPISSLPTYFCVSQGFLPFFGGGQTGGGTGVLCAPGADMFTLGQAPHRMLLDPETGKRFYVEMPVHPQRKTLLDPETGRYMEVLFPQQTLYPPSITPYPYLQTPAMYAPQYLPYPLLSHPQAP